MRSKPRLQHLGASMLALGTVLPGMAHAQQASASWVAPLTSISETAAQEGITFNSQYVGEFATNPTGGMKTGSAYTGQLNVGSDVDLAQLAAIPGASFHVNFTDRAGTSLASKWLNNSVSVQQVYGAGMTWQLSLLTYEQKFGSFADVVIGRDDVDNSFIGYDFLCDFQSNASCGNTGILGKDTSIDFNPVPVWGGRIKITPTDNLYAETGLYQSSSALKPPANNGFNWGTKNSNGYDWPIEAGYVSTTPGATEQNKYDIGAIFDRVNFSAPYYQAGSANQFGRTLLYAQAQQMVYQFSPNSPRGIYLFGVAMYSPDGQKQVAQYSIEGGVSLQGPFAARPRDTLGLMASDVHYNSDFLTSLYNARLNAGGSGKPHSDMTMIELNYAAQVTPWLNIMPNLQYVINPDGLGGGGLPLHNEKSAVVFGVQFAFDVAKFTGAAS